MENHKARVIKKTLSILDNAERPLQYIQTITSMNTYDMSRYFDIIGHYSDQRYEDPDNYQHNGLPPLLLGSPVPGLEQYTIIQKLGFGGSCTVWLCHDGRKDYKVVKTISASHSTARYTSSEIKVLYRLTRTAALQARANRLLVVPSYSWRFHSRNGTHVAHFLPVMGPSIEDAIINPKERSRMPAALYQDFRREAFAPVFAKSCLRDILHGLHHLHSQGIIHGDFRIDQVLMSIDTADMEPFGIPEYVRIFPKYRVPVGSYPPRLYSMKPITQGIADLPTCKIGDLGAALLTAEDNSGLSISCNW